jgi:membrane-bound lytic murein transglycosylase F
VLRAQLHHRYPERLPLYIDWFNEAAAEVGMDWRMLAAIGYQERSGFPMPPRPLVYAA